MDRLVGQLWCMAMPDTALLDTLLAGLSGRNATSCILRRAQQAAYAPGQYTKSVRTSLFPTYLDLSSTVKPADLWEACGLPVVGGEENSSAALEASIMDPRTELMQILAAQKSAIEHAEPPKAYIYASANDYSLLRDAIKDFLIQVDTIVSSTELKELAFELTTGTTAPPSIIAPLQDMRSKLERLARFRETLSRHRTAAADLEAVLEHVPRLEPLAIPIPDSSIT